MQLTAEQVFELEWANYVITRATARVTPGLEVVLREDVVFNSSEAFPTPDFNHACLLRAAPETVNALIDDVVSYFNHRNLSPTVYISPACTPDNLAEVLMSRGFSKQKETEAWMILDNLPEFEFPALHSDIAVKQITTEDAQTFAEVFMQAFDMPLEFAPYMAQLMAPSIGLPGIFHYLAEFKGQPVGTCSILCHDNIGILGSFGVVSGRRRLGAATNMAVTAMRRAIEEGADQVVLQTTEGTLLERLLRISGFKKAFTRVGYTKR
ncbi:MAG: GNAT family N-acetyltransferase [Anaerolineae bacterium]|nr:GNAT family N-acetyltransferase [Anaerolineae bacterium]